MLVIRKNGYLKINSTTNKKANKEKRFQKFLEDYPGRLDNFINPDYKYYLISPIKEGANFLHLKVGANSIEALRNFWQSEFVQKRYNTPQPQFIINKDQEVVEILDQ